MNSWLIQGHAESIRRAHTGNDVRVVQELMRHAKLSTTLEVYTHASMDKKRVAQKKAVDLLLDRNRGTEPGDTTKEVCSLNVPA